MPSKHFIFGGKPSWGLGALMAMPQVLGLAAAVVGFCGCSDDGSSQERAPRPVITDGLSSASTGDPIGADVASDGAVPLVVTTASAADSAEYDAKVMSEIAKRNDLTEDPARERAEITAFRDQMRVGNEQRRAAATSSGAGGATSGGGRGFGSQPASVVEQPLFDRRVMSMDDAALARLNEQLARERAAGASADEAFLLAYRRLRVKEQIARRARDDASSQRLKNEMRVLLGLEPLSKEPGDAQEQKPTR